MDTARNGAMGRVNVQVELASNAEVLMAQLGMFPQDKVKRLTLPGVVDTGATRLMLPESVVNQLGLLRAGQVTVRYADNRAENRPMVHNVWLKLQGRESVFTATVEPARTDALIGAIVLEELDFLVDCNKQCLIPRDPNAIISEAESVDG